MNKYLNLNLKNNNKLYNNSDDNNLNQINYFSKNNINKSSSLLKSVEIPYLIKGQKLNSNNNQNNIFQSNNNNEISKESLNNKRAIKKRKFNSQIKIYEKKYYFIDNNPSNHFLKIKINKENLCFISYSYNEYPNIPYRKSMEDYHCIKQNLLKNSPMYFSYFSIFDGHSGSEVALFLSKYLHKILSKNLSDLKINNNDIQNFFN